MGLIPIDWKMKMIYNNKSFISISFDFKFDLTSSDLVWNIITVWLCARWVYEKDGQLRAEVEGPDGVKRGVYTVAGADGQIKTQAYISGGNQGHRSHFT